MVKSFSIVGNLKHQFEDWYTIGDDTRLFNWYKYAFKVQGPGTKIEYPDHIDFVANNFAPEGSIVLTLYMHDLSKTVEGCNGDELISCWPKALQSALSTRPYRGHKSCYDESDLRIMMVKDASILDRFIFFEQAIPFLRNEIYARKGYIFNLHRFSHFFERMPWYKPKQQEVQLNKIEKWNVDFLREIEKESDSEQDLNEDTDKLNAIYSRMENTCPTVNPGQ